jgi:hypothetical protein
MPTHLGSAQSRSITSYDEMSIEWFVSAISVALNSTSRAVLYSQTFPFGNFSIDEQTFRN